MANAIIQLPADGAGKKLDAESLTVAAQTVYRERDQIAGVNDDDIAVVVDTDPGPTDHGLVVRQAEYVSPQYLAVNSVDLAAGASVDLDGDTIPSATTGKLVGVSVSSSVACRWEVKTRDGGVETTVAVLFTSALQPQASWAPPSKAFVTLAGAGVDENFRCTATNLDDARPANVYASFFWDEV